MRIVLVASATAFVFLSSIADAQRRRPRPRTPFAISQTNPNNYATFTHYSHGKDAKDPKARKLICASCHTIRTQPLPDPIPARDDLPKYPYHDACFGCHQKEVFRSGARPAICTVCHTRVSPRATARDMRDWQQRVSAKFVHAGGGKNNHEHVKDCMECHERIFDTTTAKLPDVPIKVCFTCHKSSTPNIVKEMQGEPPPPGMSEKKDKGEDEDTEEGRNNDPTSLNGTHTCAGCHLLEIGRRPPPCSHFRLFAEEYFDVEYFPKSAKQLEARCKK